MTAQAAALPPTKLPPIAAATNGLSNFFRVAELVWYYETVWRLGVIRRIVEQDDNFRHNTYDIVPLGHMLFDQ